MGERDSQRKTHVLKGIGVSPGIATGKALILDYSIANVPCYQLGGEAEVLAEISRFEKALKESRRQLAALRKKLSDREGPKPLFIIDIHMMMLKDKTLINNTVNVIREG